MALERFEVFIGSSNVPVIIHTDHNPLDFLDRMRNKNIDELERAWQAFSVVVGHIHGRDNARADALFL